MLLPRLGSFAIVSGVWFHHWTFQLSVSLCIHSYFPYLLCGLDLFLSASPLPSYCTNSSYEYTCHCSPNTVYIMLVNLQYKHATPKRCKLSSPLHESVSMVHLYRAACAENKKYSVSSTLN